MKRITLHAATLALALVTIAAATARAEVAIMDNNQKLTVDCAKEKSVSIVGNKATVTLNGTCDRVQIAGNKATVRGSAVQVYVAGNDNTLELDAADEIYVPGNRNTVSFKKGVKARTPKVSSPGNDNKISQTK